MRLGVISLFALIFCIGSFLGLLVMYSLWGWTMRRLVVVIAVVVSIYFSFFQVVAADGFVDPPLTTNEALDVLVQGVFTLSVELHRAIFILGFMVLLQAAMVLLEAFVLRRSLGSRGGDDD